MSDLLTLREAAKILGVSYERVRTLVNEGRIPIADTSRRGRVIKREDLERFQRTRLPPGRPPTRRPAPPRVHRAPGSVRELLEMVEKRTKTPVTLADYRNLIKVGLLPGRREFPPGERGRRLCFARQYRLLTFIVYSRTNGVKSYRDLAIALKLHGYRVPYDILTRAMLSYLYVFWKGRRELDQDEIDRFSLNEAAYERPPKFFRHVRRRVREQMYRSLLRVGVGSKPTDQDLDAVLKFLGLPKEMLPILALFGGSPSINDLVLDIQTLYTKIDHLTEKAIISEVGVGQRERFKPFATPEELDKAWTEARPLIFELKGEIQQKLSGVHGRTYVSYVNAIIVLIVTICLILLREHGEEVKMTEKGVMYELQ
jgi:excisionase family DNA binding protein